MKKLNNIKGYMLLISLLAILMLVGCNGDNFENGVSEHEATPTSAVVEEKEEIVEPTSEPASTSNPTEALKTTEEPEKPQEPTEAPETTEESKPDPKKPDSTEPSHTHNYSAVVTQPTCTAQGYTTYTCNCGDSYRDNYTNGSHNYSNGTCTACGASDPNYIPPHTHSWTEHTWTEDVVSETRVEVFECDCGIEWATIDECMAHQMATPQCTGWRNHTNWVETITQIIHHYRECACGAREDID